MLAVKTILHPTDFSLHSDYAFQVALALARDYGARLVVAHVRQPQPVVYGEFVTTLDTGDDPAALQEKLAKMRQNFNEVSDTLQVSGDPGAEIVGLAAAENCDLIVIGTHGRTGLQRLLMGSVAEEVVRRAPCPVLTVKNPVPTSAAFPAAATCATAN